MKKFLFLEILEQLKARPKLMKKFKILAVLGVVGFLITGTLLIWAGVSAMSYVTSSATHYIQSPVIQHHVENIKTELKSLPRVEAASCWEKAQSLIAVQPWLERPALENMALLGVACFEQRPTTCQDEACKPRNESSHSVEGSFI